MTAGAHRSLRVNELIVDALIAGALTSLSLVAIVSLGGVPKTSSGKLRRGACREALLDGSLGEIARWTAITGLAGRAVGSRLSRTGA